jgi:hypothetical protein
LWYIVAKKIIRSLYIYMNSLSGGLSPTGSTRHGGHWLAYFSLPRVIMMVEKFCGMKIGRGSNPGRRGERPATNRLSYGAAYIYMKQ